MRLQVLLPKVEPEEIRIPLACVYAGCASKDVQLHQPVEKALRDTKYTHVEVQRYRCLTCGRTFRAHGMRNEISASEQRSGMERFLMRER